MSNTMITTILFLDSIYLVYSNYYCEFGLCDDQNQYCCGLNTCCNKNLNLWLFWSAVLLVVFILVLIAIFRRRRKQQQEKPGYEKVSLCLPD